MSMGSKNIFLGGGGSLNFSASLHPLSPQKMCNLICESGGFRFFSSIEPFLLQILNRKTIPRNDVFFSIINQFVSAFIYLTLISHKRLLFILHPLSPKNALKVRYHIRIYLSRLYVLYWVIAVAIITVVNALGKKNRKKGKRWTKQEGNSSNRNSRVCPLKRWV